MATVKLIDGHKDLNATGCSFFINLTESVVTRVTSSDLRWLSLRENEDEFITPNQKEACDKIENILSHFHGSEWNKINLKVLLFSNPTKSANPYLVKLINCGADIRYIKSSSKIRLAICKNLLYLTLSTTPKNVVNSGMLYSGRTQQDPLIDFYTSWFDTKFASARKTKVKNGKVVFDDSFWEQVKIGYNRMDSKDWIGLILGAILGALIGFVTN